MCILFYDHSSRPIAVALVTVTNTSPARKCHVANLLNYHTQNKPKVNLTTWTNIITLAAKRINCCLLLRHFVSNFCFAGSVKLHLKPRFWLAESTEPMWLVFGKLGTQTFLLMCWRGFGWSRWLGWEGLVLTRIDINASLCRVFPHRSMDPLKGLKKNEKYQWLRSRQEEPGREASPS